MNEAGGQRQTLLPSARKFAGELVFAFCQSQLLDAFTHSLSPILQFVHARDKIEIFLNAQVLPKTKALRHVTDFPFDRFTFGEHVVTQDPTASVVSSEQSAKHAQKGGLAATVWTKEPVDFAGGHGEINMIDRSELAEPLRHSAHLDDRFAVFHLDLNSTS